MRRRRDVAPRRVFLGLADAAGAFARMQTGLAAHGVPSTVADLTGDVFAYGAGTGVPLAVRAARAAHRWRRAAGGRAPVPTLVAALAHAWLFGWALARHDAFVFGGRVTFARGRDLPLLRLLGKRVVCVFWGSDERPAYLDGSLMAPDRGRDIADGVAHVARQKAEVRRIDRWSHAVIAHVLSAHLHERPVVRFTAVGLPFAPDGAGPVPEPGGDPVVLHAPTHPAAKGTDEIRAVVRRLRERGTRLRYDEVAGVPNAEVLRRIDGCAVVVDQLYSDVPTAGLATEASARGRAVVVAGYGIDELAALLPYEERAPVVFVRPGEVEERLAALLSDPDLRRAAARRARTHVVERCAPEAVAGRLLRVLRGDVPPEWLFDPAHMRYVHGACLPEARARELVGAFVADGGVAALQVDDKPALRAALLDFAAGP
jgi:glycosyltransferase involved in cell wall biosynthesis